MTEQTRMWQRWLALATALAVLVLVNHAIVAKQAVLRDGQVFYLELAPVDPRSLLQGDYMALNYAIAADLGSNWPAEMPGDAWVQLDLDENGVASAPLLHASRPTAVAGKVTLRVRKPEWRVVLATDGYYFEEGQADRYSGARYGRFHSDGVDKALLTRLVDEQFKAL